MNRCRQYWRIVRLGSRVICDFLNPFGSLFMHPLAFEVLYWLTHEQEVAEQMSGRTTYTDYSFVNDLLLIDDPGHDAEAEIMTADGAQGEEFPTRDNACLRVSTASSSVSSTPKTPTKV